MDRFRGRLIWPIRDLTGDVIAFGARKLAADDDGPKYLNTPETPLFKKSSVLYGADLAKREIAQRRQAVIVEGYTDVMACHLAGVPTAVATCGTSFGDGHIKVLRRLLMDADQFQGEVIFTFDGDAAGQRAALRAFDLEERFVTQTFVAVQPDGLDPCDLRLKQGDAAVRDLVAQRVPLFEFAIRSELGKHNLDTNEGRLAALDAAARIIGRIKDRGLRDRYAISLDRWLGMLDEEFVLARVRQHGGGQRGGGQHGGGQHGGGQRRAATAGQDRVYWADRQQGPGGDAGGPARSGERGPAGQQGGRDGEPRYDLADPVIQVEREALKLAIQRPALCGPAFDAIDQAAFTAAQHTEVRELIAVCGGTGGAGNAQEWTARLRDKAPRGPHPCLRDAAGGGDPAGAESGRRARCPLRRRRARAGRGTGGQPQHRDGQVAAAAAQPGGQTAEYNRTFGDLVALEQRRKALLEKAAGAL